MSKSFNTIAYIMIGLATSQLLGLLSVMYPVMTAGCYFTLLLIVVGLLIRTYIHGVKSHLKMNGYPGLSTVAMVPGFTVTIVYVLLFFYGVSLFF